MRFNPGKIIDEQFGIGKNGIVKRASRKAGKLNIGFIKSTMYKPGKVKKRQPNPRPRKSTIRKTSMRERTAGKSFSGKINAGKRKTGKIHTVKIGIRLKRRGEILMG